MGKLKLQATELGANQILSRSQLKSVMGGSGNKWMCCPLVGTIGCSICVTGNSPVCPQGNVRKC